MFEEIVYIRCLKESIIEDYIVELVLFVLFFLIDVYVLFKQQEKIILVFEGLCINKLKVIKEEVKDDVIYFQICFVLVKYFI